MRHLDWPSIAVGFVFGAFCWAWVLWISVEVSERRRERRLQSLNRAGRIHDDLRRK